MKKAGIVTFYHNSVNFGGVLQAYALCEVLRRNGIEAEQIPYCYRKRKSEEGILHKIQRKGITEIITSFTGHLRRKANKQRFLQIQKQKQDAFLPFLTEKIPHNKQVYDNTSIAEAVHAYDAFITGSDQVFNSYDKTFFLDFVPKGKGKVKLSYAASSAKGFWSEEEKELIQKALSLFTGISVRDYATAQAVQSVTGKTPETVADPTLLLRKEDWDAIKEPVSVGEKYLLCYFLGDNKKPRKLARAYAAQHGLQLANIPMAGGGIAAADKHFGKAMYDVSPPQFLSLIENAEAVFTDSFHCTVLSHVYQKNYFVFNRSRTGAMNMRIKDITALFKTEDRFCDGAERETMAYISHLPAIDFAAGKADTERLVEHSMVFLLDNLKS